MTEIVPDAIRRIAIIGAGPSGLTTAKYLLAEGAFSEITIFEQRCAVGGLWHYTPLIRDSQKQLNGDPDSSKSAVDIVMTEVPEFNTPMYEGLESNLPDIVMQFSDTPFEKTQLFARRETVLDYIRGYADDLRSLLRLEHRVVDLNSAADDRGCGWEVSIQAKGESAIRREKFDAVVVAVNGHTDWPLLPPVDGLDEWSKAYPDSIFHSVSYKNADAFADKRVLIVGAGPSGADINRQIGSVCKPPLLVARREVSPYHTDEPYTRDYPGLTSLDPSARAATFEDGSIERDIDAIVFCTGYSYTFPFLKSFSPRIEYELLYQYIFYMPDPTLAFVEMPEKIVPFPFAECQAAAVARVWSGRLTFPSKQEMQEWGNAVVKERGIGRGFYALTPPLDLQYMNEIYDWCCKAKDEAKRIRKMPKYWGKKEWWEREMAAEMKKAFNARGKERKGVRRYEELGFQFEEAVDGG